MLPLFIGSEDVPCMFSPISKVHTEVGDPEVWDIPEVVVPSFSLVPTDAPHVLGGTSLSPGGLVGTPSSVTIPTSDLPETPITDHSRLVMRICLTLLRAPGMQLFYQTPVLHMGQICLRLGVDLETHLGVLPSLGVLLVTSTLVVVPFME